MVIVNIVSMIISEWSDMILPLQSEIFQNLETFLDICQSSVPAQLREDARDDFLDEADTFIRWARRCATVLAKHTIMDHRMERPKVRTYKSMPGGVCAREGRDWVRRPSRPTSTSNTYQE